MIDDWELSNRIFSSSGLEPQRIQTELNLPPIDDVRLTVSLNIIQNHDGTGRQPTVKLWKTSVAPSFGSTRRTVANEQSDLHVFKLQWQLIPNIRLVVNQRAMNDRERATWSTLTIYEVRPFCIVLKSEQPPMLWQAIAEKHRREPAASLDDIAIALVGSTENLSKERNCGRISLVSPTEMRTP